MSRLLIIPIFLLMIPLCWLLDYLDGGPRMPIDTQMLEWYREDYCDENDWR